MRKNRNALIIFGGGLETSSYSISNHFLILGGGYFGY